MLPRNILVPIDFSTGAERALDYACELAAKTGATIHLVNGIGAALPELSVALTDQMIATLREGSRAALEKLVAARPNSTFGRLIVVPGDARDAILETAITLPADLIVMGTHGRRGISRLVLGSVAEYIVRHAPCPVLSVRGDKEKEK